MAPGRETMPSSFAVTRSTWFTEKLLSNQFIILSLAFSFVCFEKRGRLISCRTELTATKGQFDKITERPFSLQGLIKWSRTCSPLEAKCSEGTFTWQFFNEKGHLFGNDRSVGNLSETTDRGHGNYFSVKRLSLTPDISTMNKVRYFIN